MGAWPLYTDSCSVWGVPWPLWDGVGGDEVRVHPLSFHHPFPSIAPLPPSPPSFLQPLPSFTYHQVMEETDALGVVGYLCKYYYDNSLPGGVCSKE